jgi:type VI protein secretion system component Hcp
MIRDRARNRMVARVESMEGRKLMATNSFIHLGALTGTALADFHHGETPASDGWVPFESFALGGGNRTAGGKVSVSSFNIELKINRASSALTSEATTGKIIPEVEVAEVDGSTRGTTLLEYDFKHTVVESVQFRSNGTTPTETVSFAFGTVAINYSFSSQPPTNHFHPPGQS